MLTFTSKATKEQWNSSVHHWEEKSITSGLFVFRVDGRRSKPSSLRWGLSKNYQNIVLPPPGSTESVKVKVLQKEGKYCFNRKRLAHLTPAALRGHACLVAPSVETSVEHVRTGARTPQDEAQMSFNACLGASPTGRCATHLQTWNFTKRPFSTLILVIFSLQSAITRSWCYWHRKGPRPGHRLKGQSHRLEYT